MEVLSGFIGFILVIVGILVVFAILSIETHTRKSNQLLRRLLNEKNPERFELTSNTGKVRDNKYGKKI